VFEFAPIAGQPSVFSDDELNDMDVSTEHTMIASMTPRFFDLFGTDLHNSEYHPWIQTGIGQPLKPDNFLCDPVFCEKKDVPNVRNPALKALYDDGNVQFAILADWRLRDHVQGIWEAKLGVGHGGLGELVTYMQWLHGGKSDVYTPAMLYDKTGFWLIPFINGQAMRITKVNWSDGGSRKALRDFFTEERTPARSFSARLQTLASRSGVSLTLFGFLGKGAFGHVVRASPLAQNDGQTGCFAMKVVEGRGERKSVRSEFEFMSRLQQIDGVKDMVAKVSNFLATEWMCSYLMEPVGMTCSRETKGARLAVCSALRALHAMGVTLGDPRIQNAIKANDRVMWIDFREGVLETKNSDQELHRTSTSNDVRILFKSLFGEDCAKAVVQGDLLFSYLHGYAEENMVALHDAAEDFVA
jgi:tRNA A-37 threonylcarbamoyl transferase component Bud32